METRSKTGRVVKPRDEVEFQYSFPPGNKWGGPELNRLNVTFQHQPSKEIRSLTKFIMSRSGFVVPDELVSCIPPVRHTNDFSD